MSNTLYYKTKGDGDSMQYNLFLTSPQFLKTAPLDKQILGLRSNEY